MRIIFFSLLFFSTSLTLHAQKGTISGTISGNGQPLEFASVGVKNTSLGGVTDINGRFLIDNLPYGDYQLAISTIGYKPITKSITLSTSNPIVNFELTLEEAISSLDEVVISGTMKEVSRLDSPVPVEVYSPEFFRANPTPSIFESLQNVNGVRPQLNCNVCNTGDIHINGLEGPYTMITIDGMPIVSGLSTVYGLTGIPQALIERVEIVKGPASTLYGSEAVGGLINIITKKPSNAPLVSADVSGSTWGEVSADLGVKFRAGENANSLLGVSYFNYQNIIDNNGDGFTDVTLQDRISIFNKWSFDRKDNRVFSIAGRYVYEDRWGGDTRWTTEFRGGDQIYGESIYTDRWEMFGVYQLPVDEIINFQFSANGHKQNSVYGNTIYNADQYVGFGQLTWNKSLGPKHDLLAGASFRYTYYDDDTPATASQSTSDLSSSNDPSITYLPGLFIQNEFTINNEHKLLGGLRYDYNSLHGGIFSPRLNYKWNTPDKKTTVRLGVGNGYRVANVFTEDHAALTGARDVIFEEELRPETSWNVNLNIVKKIYTQNNTFIGLDASAFYTYFNNRIIPDYDTNPNQIIYDNLDGFSVSQGVSLNADIAWESGLTALIGFTYQDVFLEENGERIDQLLTESFSGVWNIGYTFNKIGLTVDYTGNLYGPMRLPVLGELDNRRDESPWWSVQNIQLTKKLKDGLEVYGGVKNILNYTPPANSISRPFDPFDNDVTFDNEGQVVPTTNNPNALTFDPNYVFAPNQGIRGFFGVRYTLNK